MRRVPAELMRLFKDFRKLPKGFLVRDQFYQIDSGIVLPRKLRRFLKLKNRKTFFTRLSLKHLAEKGTQGVLLFHSVKEVLMNPGEIREGFRGRFLFVANRKNVSKDAALLAVSMEMLEDGTNIIVTAFIANAKYLQNFKILWRTEAP